MLLPLDGPVTLDLELVRDVELLQEPLELFVVDAPGGESIARRTSIELRPVLLGYRSAAGSHAAPRTKSR